MNNIDDLKTLLNKDVVFFENDLITNEILTKIDESIINRVFEISEECFGIYKKFVVMKQNAPEGMKNDLFRAVKNYLREQIQQKNFSDALLLSRFLIVKSKLEAQSYYDIAEIFSACGDNEFSKLFLEFYQNLEVNLPLKLLTVANFYNFNLKDYKSAIKYYEQYLKIEETKFVIFTTLGNLYKKVYGDDSLKDQIYYYEKAYALTPNNRLVLHSLAFNYEKLGDKVKADKYYKELLNNNPTEIDYYNYGGFLVSCGDLYNGHKFLTHRFNIEDNNLKYPQSLDITKKWDFKTDISDKILLVHYEQGFGDTFMYCRFIPLLEKICKKIIFVVQEEVFDLISNSPVVSQCVEIVSDKFDSNVVYDYSMALMDSPFALKITADKIPYTQGYLSVDDKMVQDYKEKYLKRTNNLKVGISYCGNKNANYKGRDIEFSKLSKVFELKNIDFYSFNMETENSDCVTNLSSTFESFTQTALALKNMDVVISTDNVILNLAGAMGVKTIALFNKYPNFRWFKLSGDDVGYYKSVKPLQVSENDRWFPVISDVINILKEM